MTRDGIAAFHGQHYRPGNIVLAAAGDLDHDQVVGRHRAPLRRAGRGRRPRPHGARPAPPAGCRWCSRPTEQAHLVVGVPAPDRDDDDRYALSILDHVLGGGMSSRLFQEIREQRGLAYSVYSYRSAYQDTGALAVYAGTAPGRVREVLDLIDAELDRLLADGVTDRELDMAKGHLQRLAGPRPSRTRAPA